MPSIRDDDPDLDRHDLAFENNCACYAYGGRKLRGVDRLRLYGNSFKEGSTRRKVFDIALRIAISRGRVPDEAVEVLKEIRSDLRTYIWETPMQKKVRLDHQFENLQQGGMSHADFRAVWTDVIQGMTEAKMDLPSEETLFRKYLIKLNPEFRKNVLSKD